MRKAGRVLSGLLLGCCCGLLAQPRGAIVGAGYTNPRAFLVAPGQVLTFFVHGLQTKSLGMVASTRPLPSSLAGVSLTYLSNDKRIPLPLFRIEGICGSSSPSPPFECDPLTAITAQVPFDIPFGGGVKSASPPPLILVSENSIESTLTYVQPRLDKVHVLGSCEIGSPLPPYPCFPVVTHADGKLLSPSNPATAGEILVLYAVGLGATDPPVKAGEPTPMPAPTVDALVGFDVRPNAPPMLPADPSRLVKPLFAGLTPGEVGLYQVNFQVPPMPADTPSCGDNVNSNLTVTVAAGSWLRNGPEGFVNATTFDGAGICVQTGGAAAQAKPVGPPELGADTRNLEFGLIPFRPRGGVQLRAPVAAGEPN